jgi:tetratricopeptide (TPR) repeat protein
MAILLANGTQIKVNANSELLLKQIAPPSEGLVAVSTRLVRTLLRLFNGEIWVRSYGEPLKIKTVPGTATVRGTELNLATRFRDTALLSVVHGLVEFSNPQGRIIVRSKEQALARVGEAPSKTILLNPLDAVQWSLYYPGIVSYRDYPLTSGIGLSGLQDRLTKLERRVTVAPRDVNAIIELGEILYDLGRREAYNQFQRALSLVPKQPRALTGLGWVYLEGGETEAALKQFQQAQPPTLMTLIGMANTLYRLNRFGEAMEVITEAKRRFPKSPGLSTQAALINLVQGQVPEALAELSHALAIDPGYALAYGLRSNIYLVQNQRERALESAQRAVTANPFSPSTYLDLSLVKQAEFKLEEALKAARKAVEVDRNNPQALIQVSRLLFGSGQINEAFEAAEKARGKALKDPVVTTTWGFLQLAKDKVNEAIVAFDQAIASDSTRGEPHLGKGLALFRRSRIEEGIEQMRIATLLEPKVSLYHSYLGKAFYEVKRDKLAAQQFDSAKELDPHDPTPHFYEAIQKQSVNQPVEALQGLQRSITLNDNRAIYRSRLLLDNDLAARGATVGRIYNELGFQQLALVEGWKSINTNPTDYSAHRLLADSYSALPRHEIARVSELLQSQLLQPVNISPVQPQLAETDSFILDGAGPTDRSLNEFNSLFLRDRLAVQASGIVGGNNTFGDEVVHSGIWGKLSYSLGQFHYETEGFRENNDLKQDIYNVFVQGSLSPKTSLQGEFRYTDIEEGDRGLRFFTEDNFTGNLRDERHIETARLGFHQAVGDTSDIIASFIYKNIDSKLQERFFDVIPSEYEVKLDEDAYLVEGQYLFRSRGLNFISGVGHFMTSDRRERLAATFFFDGLEAEREEDIRHTNLYAYLYLHYLKNVTLTLGVSADFFKFDPLERNQINPKFGLTWNPFPSTTLRATAFRVLNLKLDIAQTIEPTHLAGFNQFFGTTFEQTGSSQEQTVADPQGSNVWRYGVAIDQKFSTTVSAGAELSKGDLKVPFISIFLTGEESQVEEVSKWDEYLARAYTYWTPHPWVSAGAEYQFERFKRELPFEGFQNLETHRVPLRINFFHPSGWGAGIKATYVEQDIEQGNIFFTNIRSGSDQFWVVDANIRYRLPNRLGFIIFGVNNLFDQEFNFEETDPGKPTLQRDRFIFGRITVAY